MKGIPVTVLAAALAIALASRVGVRRITLLAVVASGIVIEPALGLVGMAVVLGVQSRRWRPQEPPDPRAPIEVAQLLAVGVAAGLSVVQSLSFCAERGPPELRRALIGLLREVQFAGLERAAAGHRGRLADVLAAISTALRSGAPIELMLRSYAAEARATLAAQRTSRARKLPGVLAVPLALLLLPGFVLMVMGPAVLEMTARMLAPLSSG